MGTDSERLTDLLLTRVERLGGTDIVAGEGGHNDRSREKQHSAAHANPQRVEETKICRTSGQNVVGATLKCCRGDAYLMYEKYLR